MNQDPAELIRNLSRPEAFDHPVNEVRVVETHISWVLLTGRFAYKIKKPVDLGFVDASTLARRRHYCAEELRLNRRLAPELYLEVVPISGTTSKPRVNGSGPVLEYAVKMAEFPHTSELDLVVARGELEEVHLVDLARRIAAFHRHVPVAAAGSPLGAPQTVLETVRDTLSEIRRLLPDGAKSSRVEAIREWSEEAYRARRADLEERKKRGFVRECHGDLHLANMVLLDGRIVVFDAIDFSERLRWIDVMSEIAFLKMDLRSVGRADLGAVFVNEYLEWGGDYEGVSVLEFYSVYRALVRGKVSLIRAQQVADAGERAELERRCSAALEVAREAMTPASPDLTILHGVSGGGKTAFSRKLAVSTGAIRISSDVERKRLYGFAPSERTESAMDAGVYAPEATERTYDRLLELAGSILRAGFRVIIDASFLRYAHRRRCAELARRLGVPFSILSVRASPEVLRQRIRDRQESGGGASEADVHVLERQERSRQPLRAEEVPFARDVDTETADEWPQPGR